MTLRERLRQVVRGVPDEGAVTLPVSTLRAWLEEAGDGLSEEGSEVNGRPVADLTVPELADALDRSASTVRGWLPDVPGAYKLGSEWRVPRAAWRAYLDELAEDEAEVPLEVRSRPGAELSDWRRERGS